LPIDFVYTGVGSGTLNGAPFAASSFTITEFADTSNRQSCIFGGCKHTWKTACATRRFVALAPGEGGETLCSNIAQGNDAAPGELSETVRTSGPRASRSHPA